MKKSNKIKPTTIQVITEPIQFGPIVVNTMKCELSEFYNHYHLIYSYKPIDGTEEKEVNEMLFVEYTIGDCYNSISYLPYVLDDAKDTCAELLKNTADTNVFEKTIKKVFEDKLTLGYKVFIFTEYAKGEKFQSVYQQFKKIKKFTYSVNECNWKYSYQDVLTVSYTYKPIEECFGLLIFKITTTSEDYTTEQEVYTNTLCEYGFKEWLDNEEKINFLLQKFNDYISRHPVRMKSLYCYELFRKIPSIISEENFNEENVNDDYIREIVSKIKLDFQLLWTK